MKQEAEKNLPLLLSADALENMPELETNWLIKNLLPSEGLVILAAPPKKGKSWLMLWLARSIAKGNETFLSQPIERSTGVLYLALEDTQNRLVKRLHKLQVDTQEYKQKLQFCIQIPGYLEGLNTLTAYLKQDDQIKLVIIDTLGKFSVGRSQQGYQEDYDWIGKIKDIADSFHVAIIVVHHFRKQKDVEDAYNDISGTTGISGAADTLWLLQRKTRSNDAKFIVIGRDLDELSLDLTFSPDCIGESKDFQKIKQRRLKGKSLLIF